MEATPTSPTKLVIRKVSKNDTTDDIDDADYENYKVYVGRDHNRTFDDRVECKGCGKQLPCWGKNSKHRKYSPEYYQHCVKECEAYKQLGLIRHCHECKHLFVSPNMFNKHICENGQADHAFNNHRAPKVNNDISFNEADFSSSFEDGILSPEDMHEMGEMNALSPRDANRHESISSVEKLVIEPDIFMDEPEGNVDLGQEDSDVKTAESSAIPNSMLTSVYTIHVPESSLMIASFPHRVACRGCSKKLPCFNDSTFTCHYSPQYYKHVIDECIPYRRLGLIEHCAECKLVFDSGQLFEEHLDIVHKANNHILPIEFKENGGGLQMEMEEEMPPSILEQPCVQSEEFEISFKPNPHIDSWPDVTNCKGCGMEFHW